MTPAPATEAMQRRVLLRKHRELRLHVNKLYRTIEDAKSALAQVQLSLAASREGLFFAWRERREEQFRSFVLTAFVL